MNLMQIASASLGALAHFYFAYNETIGWNEAFVKKAAPSWIEHNDPEAKEHIKWAKRLAFNVGIYNLVLALGLVWTAWAAVADSNLQEPLAIFFSIWLLLAAAAAYHTKVYIAFVVQGFLALLLLLPLLRSALARWI